VRSSLSGDVKGFAVPADRRCDGDASTPDTHLAAVPPSPLLDRGDIEREANRVAKEHVSAAQRLVERHPVLRARELPGDLEPDALGAPRVDVRPIKLGVQEDLPGDAADGEPPGDPIGLLVERRDSRRLKRSSGYCATSKKSGERRCSSRRG